MSPALLTAVTTKTRLPQTTGLALEMPGIAVFQRMFCCVSTSHSTTAPCPSPLPAAFSPRKPGQLRAAVRAAGLGSAAVARPALPAAVLAGAAGGAGAPAGGVATRVHTCGVLPIVATARSIRPPRPSKLIVSPSLSATRKLVGEIATSVIAAQCHLEASAISCSPFSTTVIAAPASSLR